MGIKVALSLSVLGSLISITTAQAGPWGQCGGVTWQGPRTCLPGWSCIYSNPWYSQCLQTPHHVSALPTNRFITSTRSTSSTPPATTSSSTVQPTTTTSVTPTSKTSSSSSSSSTPVSAAKPTTGLANVARAAGLKYFGSATDTGELWDQSYVAQLSNLNEFNQITPGNSMKWDATEPSRGRFTFSNGDTIANLAQKNGQLLRGHACLWHNQLPGWVTNGNFDNSTLQTIVADHCRAVVSHYKGKIYSWDVINEPLNEDGTLRSTLFYNTIGPGYIAVALRAARAADPSAKLYINDYNLESAGPKSTGMYNLVKSLLDQGVPLDGVGFQGHFYVGQVPSSFQSVMQQFVDLGLEVALTEFDIRMHLPATAELLQQQKEDYQSAMTACKNVSGCVGVTLWDYTDKYSWVPGTFKDEGAACPWDSSLRKKPAYDGIVAGFS